MLSAAGQAEMREFYDLAFKQAWHYLARITGGDIALTEDLIQDVMLSVAKDLARGRSPKHDGGWITVVARNRFLNHVRSSARSDAREQASVDRSSWPLPVRRSTCSPPRALASYWRCFRSINERPSKNHPQ
jgi:DNA-directed RNA polymerase specialized sigma24 family protein